MLEIMMLKDHDFNHGTIMQKMSSMAVQKSLPGALRTEEGPSGPRRDAEVQGPQACHVWRVYGGTIGDDLRPGRGASGDGDGLPFVGCFHHNSYSP